MYYRNITDIVTDQGVEVDAGSLWVKDSGSKKMILKDDDQQITADCLADVFKYVVKEYRFKVYHSLDLLKILMTFKNNLVFWGLSGSDELDYMVFRFRTLLKFNEVENILASAGLSRESLEALDE